MDDTPHPAERSESLPESEEEKKRRLAWEAEMIAEADAEIEAGLYVDGADMDSWIKSLGTDHELPPPPVRHR
jgi:predicted transcriptional regulator